MLPKIIRRTGYIFKREPCLNCIVRSCCLKKCDILDQWKRRFDLFTLPFLMCYYTLAIIAVALLIGIFMLVLLLLSLAGCKGVDQMFEEY
jgi:predicted membrane metal-binding protein